MDIARQYKPRKRPPAPDRIEFGDPRSRLTLHIRPGSDILERLPEAGIEGDRIEWADPVCEGPLRRWRTDLDRRRDRAIFLSTRYFLSYGELLRNLGFQDTYVDDAPRYQETVLWFEHDLFDQLILVFLLRRLADAISAGTVSIVTLDRHPSRPRFIGLGELDQADLAALYPARVAVTPDQVPIATKVWEALTDPSPAGLDALAGETLPGLPFLGPALARYVAEFPSIRNGLGRTEQWGLEAFADGPKPPSEAFRAVQDRESAPFQGDTMFYSVLRGLTEGAHPLLRRLEGVGPPLPKLRDPMFGSTTLALTPAGEALLAGRDDWFRLHGAIRWIGGVTLIGPQPAWRYDAGAGRLVRDR